MIGSRFLRAAALAAVCSGAGTGALSAQARGTPVFFDPSYSFDTRVGVDVGVMPDAFAAIAGVSQLFYVGNCKRIALSGAAGLLRPSGIAARPNVGASASYLLNPCPMPTSTPNPTIRLFAGGSHVRVNARSVADGYIGIGAGYLIPAPVARLELWATPRAHYRDHITRANRGAWEFAASTGVYIGLAGTFGLRLAADCCDTGFGGGGGLSLWF